MSRNSEYGIDRGLVKSVTVFSVICSGDRLRYDTRIKGRGARRERNPKLNISSTNRLLFVVSRGPTIVFLGYALCKVLLYPYPFCRQGGYQFRPSSGLKEQETDV